MLLFLFQKKINDACYLVKDDIWPLLNDDIGYETWNFSGKDNVGKRQMFSQVN